MKRHILLLMALSAALACGDAEETIPGTLSPLIHVPEQALSWSKCLVGQTHDNGQCLDQPIRLALCADDSCRVSPAGDACRELGEKWRVPTFFEYERLRHLWPSYEDRFDFPQVRAAILTNTPHRDSGELAVAYRINPNDPDIAPWILFSNTSGAWVHCVSSAHSVF